MSRKLFFLKIFTILIPFISWAEIEWKTASYFKKIEFEVALIKHEPPLHLKLGEFIDEPDVIPEWHDLLKKKKFLKGITYEEYRGLYTDEFWAFRKKYSPVTREKFEKLQNTDWASDPNVPIYTSILYELYYRIDGEEYCFIVKYDSANELLQKIPDRDNTKPDYKARLAVLLKKIDGSWKAHYWDRKASNILADLRYGDLEDIEKYINTGFVYKSKKHELIRALEPLSEELKEDSIP